MNKLTKIIAVVLVLLALCLAALAWWMGRQPPPQPMEVKTVAAPKAAEYPVVVAAEKLEKGKQITASNVKLVAFPVTANGTYANAADVIGKVPAVDIAADTLVTEEQLVRGLALKLAEGERAVAIPVDEVVGVGNRIAAGDYVDVFFTLKKGSDAEFGQSRLVASRRLVLTYGAATVGEAQASPNALANSQTAQTVQARTAVLATPIDQVNQLLLAAQNGKLTLVLRHPGDNGIADMNLFPEPKNVLKEKIGLSQADKEELKTGDNQAYAGIDFSSWAGTGNVTRPHAANSGSAPRTQSRSSSTLEVIKGTQRENVSF
ncbi:Flp pilus assembly protein CpaB [Herminiimonas contaminans]|uniref:Flp pilus assembly protein CpaB n=1 Tax=Herminiimonas contaminans TaxID=1111140 RepID=A0ABS0EU42_9BURK|nr:Flp pilus assembly protein CpaB [Herminiimonas contaminans]MBF8178351.1 Flp pilus assembly protein CpaB [Herminiimonas contaminans]